MSHASQRLSLTALALLGLAVACAGSQPKKQGEAARASSTPPSESAKSTYPYLDFDPDTRPAPESATADAGTPDAAPPREPKYLPPVPTCKSVATTAPLSIDGDDTLIDSPSDPRLVSLRQYARRLAARNLQCSVGHNDGRLFNLECAGFYVNADGNPRPGGVESHLFEWNGRRFEALPLNKLFPGAKSHASLLEDACKSDEPSVYAKIWLDHSGMSFVAGLSPNDEAGCRLEYAEHADWVSCGPLAYLAGYAPRAPAPEHALPEPLGWDSSRVMSRLPSQRALVERINARLDAFDRSLNPDLDSDARCLPALTTNQVVSLRCDKNFSAEVLMNYAVRTGAELDIDTLIAVAGPKLTEAASKACNKRYLKQPGFSTNPSRYEWFSKTPIQLRRADLERFEVRSTSIRFHVEILLQMRENAPSKQKVTCDLPLSQAGLSLKKLGAIPASAN